MTRQFRLNYTKQAEELYQHAMYKGWKFRTFTSLDSWLAYGWSMLFQRPLSELDINNLKHFLEKRRNIDLKIKYKKNLTSTERHFMQEQWIGKDGYIYMTKMMPCPPVRNPKETERLEQLLEQTKWKT
jgi:hypothetical protein